MPDTIMQGYIAKDGKMVKTGASESGTKPTTDHNLLTVESRSLPDQHPMKAISGLEDALSKKQNTGDYALKSDIPEKLPNPNSITFTGGATGSYDGSSPVEINIPQESSYILPQMTENILGGAKAKTATDDQTDFVGVDAATGLLKYAKGTGGGEKPWQYIGLFEAQDNINPWVIDRDSNGKPFECSELLIKEKLGFFWLSTNTSNNTDISFGLKSHGPNPYDCIVNLKNLRNGTIKFVKGASVETTKADFPVPTYFHFKIENLVDRKLLIARIPDFPNNVGANEPNNICGTRGAEIDDEAIKQIKVSLGYPTNLVFKGSTLEIWGR